MRIVQTGMRRMLMAVLLVGAAGFVSGWTRPRTTMSARAVTATEGYKCQSFNACGFGEKPYCKVECGPDIPTPSGCNCGTSGPIIVH